MTGAAVPKGAITPVDLIRHAQRMLVDANFELIVLSQQVADGSRHGLEAFGAMQAISGQLSAAAEVLFSCEGMGGACQSQH